MRIEPPVSVPSAADTSRAATAAPEPLLEPPGRRPGAHGFAGVPRAGLTPVGAEACDRPGVGGGGRVADEGRAAVGARDATHGEEVLHADRHAGERPGVTACERGIGGARRGERVVGRDGEESVHARVTRGERLEARLGDLDGGGLAAGEHRAHLRDRELGEPRGHPAASSGKRRAGENGSRSPRSRARRASSEVIIGPAAMTMTSTSSGGSSTPAAAMRSRSRSLAGIAPINARRPRHARTAPYRPPGVPGGESWTPRSCSRRPANARPPSWWRCPSNPGCGIATEPPGMAGGAGRTAPTGGRVGRPTGAGGGFHAGAGAVFRGTAPKRGGVWK